MLTSMLIMLIALSIMFTMLTHPMSMGMIMIMQTLFISMTTGIMINMFWFSYILVITMLSGILVLFIYMASIASNEKFKTSTKMMMYFMSSIILSSISLLFVDQLEKSSMWSTSKKEMVCNEQVLSLIKLFNSHNMSMTIIVITYLFFTMIVISYVVEVSEGPLRSKS
uniref:NADH-ubiquinone oxidoreductase chain 6 n=1 Tax=Acanthaspis ruficeps TaxID=1524498 RepID=A0A343IS97_9HEMI|nr:NADH dehydrogenase subunit 6 [Acanthaspis ruficeps]AST10096.1 NADH dehydrogenase subunit 6 [Acanthaspis ruficeps]